jgi:hypothetical protein
MKNEQDAAECKVALKFLDYLRKSQCTEFRGHMRPKAKDYKCEKTLSSMEDIAKACSQDSIKDLRYKP